MAQHASRSVARRPLRATPAKSCADRPNGGTTDHERLVSTTQSLRRVFACVRADEGMYPTHRPFGQVVNGVGALNFGRARVERCQNFHEGECRETQALYLLMRRAKSMLARAALPPSGDDIRGWGWVGRGHRIRRELARGVGASGSKDQRIKVRPMNWSQSSESSVLRRNHLS